METSNQNQGPVNPISHWMREVAGLGADAVVEVREEAHCPDPSCPLRRTVIFWTDAAGHKHRTVVVKPLVYVRREDVVRAMRLVARS